MHTAIRFTPEPDLLETSVDAVPEILQIVELPEEGEVLARRERAVQERLVGEEPNFPAPVGGGGVARLAPESDLSGVGTE